VPFPIFSFTRPFGFTYAAAEAGFLIYALYAALKRRSSTVLRGAGHLVGKIKTKIKVKSGNEGQNQKQGQKQRTRVSAPHEQNQRQDQRQRQRTRASAQHGGCLSTFVDFTFFPSHGKVE
jgi:hypothetical protein